MYSIGVVIGVLGSKARRREWWWFTREICFQLGHYENLANSCYFYQFLHDTLQFEFGSHDRSHPCIDSCFCILGGESIAQIDVFPYLSRCICDPCPSWRSSGPGHVEFDLNSSGHRTSHDQRFPRDWEQQCRYIYANVKYHESPTDESRTASRFLLLIHPFTRPTLLFNRPFGPSACLKICAPTCASTADNGSSRR